MRNRFGSYEAHPDGHNPDTPLMPLRVAGGGFLGASFGLLVSVGALLATHETETPTPPTSELSGENPLVDQAELVFSSLVIFAATGGAIGNEQLKKNRQD